MQAEIEQRERDEKLEFDKLVEQVKRNVADELKKQYLALIQNETQVLGDMRDFDVKDQERQN